VRGPFRDDKRLLLVLSLVLAVSVSREEDNPGLPRSVLFLFSSGVTFFWGGGRGRFECFRLLARHHAATDISRVFRGHYTYKMEKAALLAKRKELARRAAAIQVYERG
jgi:hypothetical protein